MSKIKRAIRRKRAIKEIDNIKPMSKTYMTIVTLLDNPLISAEELEAELKYDPLATAAILKIANSPYYCRASGQIKTLQMALTLIGNMQLKDISLMKMSESHLKKERGYSERENELHEESIASAVFAKLIAQKISEDQNLAFECALLHDIGKIVLGRILSEAESEIEKILASGKTFDELESEYFGITHQEVGEMLLKKWNFPEEFVKTAGLHHIPYLEPENRLLQIVSLADILVMLSGLSTATDGLYYDADDKITERLGLSEDDMMQIMEQGIADFLELKNVFGSKG